jgi:catecholate siderophore receptor
MLVTVLFAIVAPLEVQQQPTRDTARLTPVIVRESALGGHPYSSRATSTATRTVTPLRNTPQSVSTVTAELIRDQAMQGLADVMRFVPGATMGQGEGHRDAPTLRGNSSTADFFVDGVRDDAQFVRDLYNVERVEVLGGSNAMIFGRGGGGGVINRVTKRAQWNRSRSVVLEGGSFGHRRGTVDVGGPVTDHIAARLSGLLQHSGGFRDAFTLRRAGAAPSLAFAFSDRSLLRLDAEHFEDRRRVDRGIPSFQGRPSAAPVNVFFGNPDSSHATARVTSGATTFEQMIGARTVVRASARVTAYDKFYQNVLPGAMDASGAQVSLSAYNADMQRLNAFSQMEATVRSGGRLPQTTLVGVELGRQDTDNLRLTGFFNGTATTIAVPFDAPTVATPVEFRASGSDANSNTLATIASLFAQSQLDVGSRVKGTLGARMERFHLQHLDRRTGQRLARTDNVVSPRIGLVFAAGARLSYYASYSVSHLPSAGDQFASLTVTTKTLEPERFVTTEAGVKWEPRGDIAFTAAVYDLARTNAAAPSALDPGVVVQTGRQETRGLELSASGRLTVRWDAVATFAAQRAVIASTTTAAPAGRAVPLVPPRTFSLWNRVQVAPALGVGIGVIGQSRMFAAIDNAVTLPGFWRYDAALFLARVRGIVLQANVENLLDTRYYSTSHGNNNIMPGAPRTLRVSAAAAVR